MRVLRLLATLLVVVPADASAQDAQGAAPPTASPAAARAMLFDAAGLSRALGPLSTVRFDRPQAQAGSQPDADMRGRACAGCPRRNLAWPFLDTLWLNVMYNGINHLRGHDTAKVSPATWWENMKSGFEWDNNPWGVNQLGHPYQGSNYFTSGRASGLGFYESAAVAAFGSATWEFYFENNRASFNDLINTTLGGIAIGEVLHRMAWVVRDPLRKKNEVIATIIDPLGGMHRMISGDADRAVDKPPTMIPSSLTFQMAGGVMWQGKSLYEIENTGLPFFDMALRYGNTRAGRSTVPYESFDAAFSLGGAGDVSQTGIRGRLFGQRAKAFQFGIFQTFDFIANHAYNYGGQGVEAEMGFSKALSPRTTLWMAGATGVTLLGAVNTLIPPPPEGEVPDGAGYDGTRQYDYGPGFRWNGLIQVSHGSTPYLTLSDQGYHVAVVDGMPIESRAAAAVSGRPRGRCALDCGGRRRGVSSSARRTSGRRAIARMSPRKCGSTSLGVCSEAGALCRALS